MKKLTILIALSLLAACSPKKSAVRSSTTSTAATASGFSADTTVCQSATGEQVGTIYDTTSTANGFSSRVASLLSATAPLTGVTAPGLVSAAPADPSGSGVRFSGSLKLDAAGNVLPESTVRVTVYDSVWLNNKIDSNLFIINFAKSENDELTGQFNTQTGDGYLNLKDSKGQIRFTGKIDAQAFSGTVAFSNTAFYNNLEAPRSGTLGQFRIQSCAFLK